MKNTNTDKLKKEASSNIVYTANDARVSSFGAEIKTILTGNKTELSNTINSLKSKTVNDDIIKED